MKNRFLFSFLAVVVFAYAVPAFSAPAIASIQYVSGRCVKKKCDKTVVLYMDGEVKTNDEHTGKVSHETIDRLKLLLDTTDFEPHRAKKFLGTCPTINGGLEKIYMFYVGEVERQEFSDCRFDVDPTEEPFVSVIKIIEHAK